MSQMLGGLMTAFICFLISAGFDGAVKVILRIIGTLALLPAILYVVGTLLGG